MLGPFRVVVDGRVITEREWSRRKTALLVKLLALQPHHQLHREQIIELLWPNSDPESGSNNLHKAIHLARHTLEPKLKSAAESHFILNRGQRHLITAHYVVVRLAAALVDLRFHDTRHTFATHLRANGVHEWDIRDLLGHTTTRMTSVYTHQTPANLRQAVRTLGRSKQAKVVRFKRKSVSGSSNPSATADVTDLMTRRIAHFPNRAISAPS